MCEDDGDDDAGEHRETERADGERVQLAEGPARGIIDGERIDCHGHRRANARDAVSAKIATPPAIVVVRTAPGGVTRASATRTMPTTIPELKSAGSVCPTSAPASVREGKTAKAARVTTTVK